MQPFDPSNIALATTSALSIVGCTFVITVLTWAKFKRPQELMTFRKLIFWSSVTELLLSIMILVQVNVSFYDEVPPRSCAFAMFGWFWMSFATLSFSSAMAHHLFLVFVRGTRNPNNRIYIGWVIFSWVAGLIIALLPFTMDMYGYDPESKICWLKDFGSSKMYIWEWCTLNGWMFLACVYVFVATIIVIYKMFSNRYKGKEGTLPLLTVIRLMLYPINMMISTLPNTIYITYISSTSNFHYNLFFSGGLTLGSQGWLDTILFMFDPLVPMFFRWVFRRETAADWEAAVADQGIRQQPTKDNAKSQGVQMQVQV